MTKFDKQSRDEQYFLAMKLFLEGYYRIYGPADEGLPSLLSNLGRADYSNVMPLDPALWEIWCSSVEEAQQELGKV